MKNTDRQWMKKITMNEKDENNKKNIYFLISKRKLQS